MPEREWRVFVDMGGTFTDAVGVAPDGSIHHVKVLTTSALRGRIALRAGERSFRIEWTSSYEGRLVRGLRFRTVGSERTVSSVEDYDPANSLLLLSEPPEEEPSPGDLFELVSEEEAPVFAARLLTGTPAGGTLPIRSLRLATTLGTNALLTRQGARLAFFVTRGFRDLLLIGTQARPDLFALEIVKPAPLPAAVVEVAGRIAADGTPIEPLDLPAVEREAARLASEGYRVASVALLHSWKNPSHERQVEEILRRAGFEHVSCSAELAPLIGYLSRAETGVLDAYLAPAVRSHLDRVEGSLGEGAVEVLTSAGGIVRAASFRPKDGVASGPAGGVVGMARAALRSGFDRAIGFDMGGTSTDVARFDGDYEYTFEQEVGGVRVVAPSLAIESVAAGGGSICWTDGTTLRVGPESAGARPGPACYGAGGPLTLTDVNLLLGRLDPERFAFPVEVASARAALDSVLEALGRGGSGAADPDAILEGFLDIANERMADAIREVSIRRGYDPARYPLVAFGGAGGQHACAVAARLGIGTVLVPQGAGLLSAFGAGSAQLERFAERQVLEPLEAIENRIESLWEELSEKAASVLASEGIARGRIELRRRIARLRLVGQEATIEVEAEPDLSLRRSFEERYRAIYGYPPPDRPIEVESLVAVASARDLEAAPPWRSARAGVPQPRGARRARLGGAWRQVPVFEREGLGPGASIEGPALVFEPYGATVIEPGWRAEVDRAGALLLRARASAAAIRRYGRAPDPVRLELFSETFRAIAREMGETLRRTALSTNVKERLDFSCALLDREGRLVANAPHIPVHLGSLGECVRSVSRALDLEPGDVAVTNHPAFGGSHLPDLTVIRPVFLEDGRTLLGYVASRAHHAEIGGKNPGSMPCDSRRLVEEGVVVPPTWLLRGGRPCFEEVRRLFVEAPFPSRAVEENLADLAAAAAATRAGERSLRALAAEAGPEELARAMADLFHLAATRAREALGRLAQGRYEASERLDDGSPLAVAIEIRSGSALFDFSGSAPVHPGNLNATPAIVRSVVLYVLRLLAGRNLPLNEGLLGPVRLRVPKGILNPDFAPDPARAPAVAGGNVETSQRLVDTLLKALRLAACSQGTMNNVVFGNDRFSYYETVGGGCGARPGSSGASAVHTHMTNTRITDPEILEWRYPVRVHQFAVRRGSGGRGRFRGGDGAIRELEFLEPVRVSVLTQHRVERPYGMEGGEPGLPGAQWILRASGERIRLAAVDGCEAGAGDRLLVETPGGGGWGKPPEPSPETETARGPAEV